MSLYQRPLEVVLASIKARLGVDLVEDEYVFGAPTVVADDGSNTNTSITITSKGGESTYDGAVTIRYKRLDLADLNTLVPTTIKAYQLTTTTQVAQRLNALYGTNFTTADIVESNINLTNGAGVVTLTAKPGSMGWIGTVDITIQVGAMPLNTLVTTTRLPGLNYPAANLTKPFAPMYSYWRAFTAVAPDLDTVVTGTDSISVILAALKTITGDAWIDTGPSRYSVAGATVSYVGNAADNDQANHDYDKVIVVDLLEANSLGLTGSLYLHYNTGA